MNLFELADTLPNGLHDARLARVTVDYRERTLVLELSIWMGEEGTPRELYRPARILLRERWLVNGSAEGLLAIDLSPAQRGRVMRFPYDCESCW